MKRDRKNRDPSSPTARIIHAVILGVLIVFASYGLVTIAKFIGYASFAGDAGTIYELEIEFTDDQPYYGGIAGVAVRVDSFNSEQSVNLNGNQIEKENLLFSCLNPTGEQEIYASFIPEDQLDLSTVTAATPAEVDAYIGINSSSIVSATRTYTESIDIQVGAQTITGAPGAYSYQPNLVLSDFATVLLKDAAGNLIFGSILTNFTSCFDTSTCNFQSLLPIQGGANQTYYLWRDPSDSCPAGESGGKSFSLVIGNVTDSDGNNLEDVIVDVAGFTTVSDSTGFYNLTTVEGTYNIFAIKEGYQTYNANVTVVSGNTTIHNIIMVAEVTPNPFTGVGPGQDPPGTQTETGVGPGVGPGEDVGPGEAPLVPIIEEPTEIEGTDYIISVSEIKRKLRIDSFLQEVVKFISFKTTSAEVDIEINGSVKDLIVLDKENLLIDPEGVGEITLTIFGRGEPGVYNGSMMVTGDMNGTIPIEIEVLPKDKIPVEALMMDIETAEKSYVAGSKVKFKTDLRNMLTDNPYPVTLFFSIQNEEGTETIWTDSTNVFIRTSFSIIKNLELPRNLPPGDYILRATANYLGLSSGSSTIFRVNVPWYSRLIFGKVPVWMVLAALALIGAGVGGYIYIKKRIEAKKRYHLSVDYDTLPKPGPRSLFVGKIAETDHKFYMNMEKFKTHTIVAGSTGGGKSVTAQSIIEEMLKKDVAVVVFDPTAQWTGMLRKCKDQGMLQLYSFFGMKPADAQAFNGNIREITEPREIIDVMKFANPGEIYVFACHRLDPKDMDIVVANAIRQMFRSNLQESKPLRLMLVFDEVHRLLPKFGGSGDGFLQIERCCREFRKWGIGVMLISQVLSDFVGTIKANINTEIQMRTRDEGDLERIRQKYGEDVLRSLVMATVGTGMLENPAYNNGAPFFAAFRPLLHSTERMSDEEIGDYNKYNEMIDQLEYSLEQLEKKEVDVFDLKLELKLARDKVKSGNFNVVNVYLEGLEPRVDKEWEKIGEKPKKLVKQMVDLEDLKKEKEKAEQERADYEEANKKADEGPKKEEGPPKWDKEVTPDKMLNLTNGMIVISQQSLFDELSAMKDDDYEKHVNEQKNDFADWIQDAIGDSDLAIRMRFANDKAEILKLLQIRKDEGDLPELTEEQKKKAQEASAFKNMADGKGGEAKPAEEEKKEDTDEVPAEAPSVEKKEEPKPEEEKKKETAEAFEKMSEETPDKVEAKPAVKEEPAPQPAQTAPAEGEVKSTESATAEGQANPAEAASQTGQPTETGQEQKPAEVQSEDAPSEKPAEQKTEEIPAQQPQTPPTEQQPQEAKSEEEHAETETPATAQQPQEEQNQPAEQTSEKPNLEELVASTPEQYFHLENGQDIKSVSELKEYLKDMPEDIFMKHVGDDYNHFADWIEGTFHAKQVADTIRNIKDKDSMAEAL